MPGDHGSTARQTLEDRLARAQSLHRDGLQEAAEPLYDAVLAADPTHFDALLYFGVLRLQQGKLEESTSLIRRALAQDPQSAEAHANLAAALQALGRHDEAIAGYERALALDPALFDASCALGTALQALGRYDEAILRYRAAFVLKSDFAEASYGLATVHQALRQYDEAIEAYRDALTIDPDYAEASCGLAMVLQALGRHDEAIAHYENALDVDPDYLEANAGLAGALHALKRHQQAIERCGKALSLEPRHAETHVTLGKALRALERHSEALESYEKALAIAPDLVEAQIGCAATLQALNRHDEAIGCCERALVIEPVSAAAYNTLGQLLGEVGRFDEAYRALERAIEIAPRLPGLYFNLFNCRKVRADDPHLASLKELARDPASLSGDEQTRLDFALAKAYSDLGEHERSFRHLLSGNARQRRQIVYDEVVVMRWFAEVQRVLTAAAIESCRDCGDPDPTPVFIVGMMRSGSTLVEQILASHPKVYTAGERKDFLKAMQSLLAEEQATGRSGAGRILTGEALRRLGAAYLARLRAGAPAAVRITDKLPANFQLLGLIHLALPNARIIHTRRDPVDTCLSCFSKLFSEEQPFTYNLGELGRYYRAYERLMEHWRRTLPAAVMLEIWYEDLVKDFETEARRILAHCGLEWDDACRSFYKTQRPVKTASVAQVRQPIYGSSIGRWRPDTALLRPLLEALGTPA
jgi:tetratricopeptide (TPR) repeat protein